MCLTLFNTWLASHRSPLSKNNLVGTKPASVATAVAEAPKEEEKKPE